MIRPTLTVGKEFLERNKRNKMKKSNQPLMLQLIVAEKSCDTVAKMLLGYVLNMPMNEPMYYEKIQATVEFLEQCLPEHPGAIAAYLQVLDKLPATVKRKIPDMILDFIAGYKEEVMKYYGGEIPSKYLPAAIVTQDKRLLDAEGNPINNVEEVMATPPKLILV